MICLIELQKRIPRASKRGLFNYLESCFAQSQRQSLEVIAEEVLAALVKHPIENMHRRVNVGGHGRQIPIKLEPRGIVPAYVGLNEPLAMGNRDTNNSTRLQYSVPILKDTRDVLSIIQMLDNMFSHNSSNGGVSERKRLSNVETERCVRRPEKFDIDPARQSFAAAPHV